MLTIVIAADIFGQEVGNKVHEGGPGGVFSLLPYIEATASMLIIDAAEISAVPGTLALFEGLKMDQFLSSTRRRVKSCARFATRPSTAW